MTLSEASQDQLLGNANADNFVRKVILKHRLQQIIRQNDNARVITDLSLDDLGASSPIYDHNQDTAHFAASINKLPITLLLLQDLRAGTLQLDQVVTWQESDRRAGAGIYDQPGAPLQASLRDVLFDMLNRSGNTAVRALVNGVIGGPAATNARLAQIPQIPHTRLQQLTETSFYMGNTTSRESLWIMEELVKIDDQYVQFIRQAMQTNIYTDMGVRSQLQGSDFILLVNKVGLLDDPDGNNRHDVGIIYNLKSQQTYAYSMLTTSGFTDTAATTQADKSLKDMGKHTLRFSGDRPGDRAPRAPRAERIAPQIERRTVY